MVVRDARVVRAAVPVHVVVAARGAGHAVVGRDEVVPAREPAVLAALSVGAVAGAAVLEDAVAQAAVDVVAVASADAEPAQCSVASLAHDWDSAGVPYVAGFHWD